MSECDNQLHSSSNHIIFQSCRFQGEPRIILRGGRADIVCGTFSEENPPKMVAVKAFYHNNQDDQEKVLAIENELRIWKILRFNPYIAKFIGTAPINEPYPRYLRQGLVSEYYLNEDLIQFLIREDRGCDNHRMRLQLLTGVIHGLEHIHSNSIVHGDLKAANVLVGADKKLAKICDFGSSRIVCPCYTGPDEQQGTMSWESPELWQKEEPGPRTFESDIWAFGCVALEVQMGMKPWDPRNEGDIRKSHIRQSKSRGGYPANESELALSGDRMLTEVWNLMKKCWQKEPEHRPDASWLKEQLNGVNADAS